MWRRGRGSRVLERRGGCGGEEEDLGCYREEENVEERKRI